MCPCNLSLDHGATYDFCRVTLVFNIREGEIEGTDACRLVKRAVSRFDSTACSIRRALT
jgi:hypothetical protein